MIAFVLSNPKHHAEMMLPVAKELVRRGRRARVVSLAELRGFATPRWEVAGVEVARVIPARVRKDASFGAGIGTTPDDRSGTLVRRTAQLAALTVVAPRLLWLLRGARVVMIPNDTAYPYREFLAILRRARIPFALLQEGIRFPLPNETTVERYGRGGANAVCTWGEGSAEHFRRIGVAAKTIHVTGNPRFDALSIDEQRVLGTQLLRDAGIASPPLLFLSNPIDDQGFCSTDAKLALFRRFLEDARGELTKRQVPLAVKLHPREDLEAFRRVAIAVGAEVSFLGDAPLFPVLAAARAAIVLASTAGLEALAFGAPLGVLEIPHHGFVFEYVARGAAVGIRSDDIVAGVDKLLGQTSLDARADAFIERHLAGRGQAAVRVAELLTSLERG